jgi:hypothetical protein
MFGTMTAIEGIEEGVEVCSHFRQGRVSPVWFIWHGRLYRVQAVTHRWVTREGYWRRYHFAVLARESVDLYELRLHSETMDWYLVRICVEG